MRGLASFLLIFIIVIVGAPLSAYADAGDCSSFQLATGSCVSANVGDQDVTLGIEVTQPGTPYQPRGGTNDWTPSPAEEPECEFPMANGKCQGFGPPKDAPQDAVTPPVQPVTLTDIASFRPAPSVAGMEPNGWMIVGLDTNFFAASGVRVVDGVLLGQAASVRFTPTAWRWTYGDGTGATLRTPGAPWAALGVAEFSATSGSHIYRAPGTYVIDLTVLYSSEYRFGGGGWSAISGTLAVPANRLTATAGDATTVLVDRECTVNLRGPGC